MAALTPRELAVRDRVETVIGLMAPGLNLLLAVGERVSRLAGQEDDWEPPRRAAIDEPGAQPRGPTRQVTAGPGTSRA